MARFDLGALNDKEFEALATDILGVLNKVTVERFKPGKDKGVDGRWFTMQGTEVVIQCKHWMRSGVAALLKHLEKVELPKVNKLEPARYVLATSLELSRDNKAKISSILQPHIVSDSDVFGREDIEDFLDKHPDVLRRHYKLWIPSSGVLLALINNAIVGRSVFSAAEMRTRLSTYVETRDAERARSKLRDLGVLIISGEPGVGKTTLAAQLATEAIVEGYELVKIEEGIKEAEDVYVEEKKQIFYFDDFLGRNFLEVITNKQDSHVLAFIKRVSADKSKRFVLTSRSNILNRGKQLSELFDLEKTGKNEFELIVGNLTRIERAKILYNHIWHSLLGEQFIDQLYLERRYLTVIDHQNYNPRLISFITDRERASATEASTYWEYVEETLDNPEGIWGYVFKRQLSADCQALAYLVAYNGRPISEEELETAFARLNPKSSALDLGRRFRDASKLGTGSVLTRRVFETGVVTYDLFNPSIGDYAFRAVSKGDEVASLARALSTTSCLAHIWSLKKNEIVSSDAYELAVRTLARELELLGQFEGDVALKTSEGLLRCKKATEWDQAFVRRVVEKLSLSDVESDFSGCLDIYDSAVRRGIVKIDPSRVEEFITAMADNLPSDSELITLSSLVDAADPQHVGDLYGDFKETVVDCLMNDIEQSVRNDDVLDGYFDLDDEFTARQQAREYVERKCEGIGLDLSNSEIDSILDNIDVADIINDNIVAASRDSDDREDVRDNVPNDAAVIESYFDRRDWG